MKPTKYSILIILFLVVLLPLQAQVDIPMSPTNGDPQAGGSRTFVPRPAATLDNVELTLLFPLATESQVILIDQDTQSVVYSQSFPSTRDLTIDLAVEGIDDGTYTLRVYAFGKWWIGEFLLENDD